MDLISNRKLCLFLSLPHMKKSFKTTHGKLKIWHFRFKEVCRQILFCTRKSKLHTFYCLVVLFGTAHILLVWSLIKREITAQLWIRLAFTGIFSEQR